MHYSKLYTLQSAALALGIIIVLNLFFNFGIRAFYAAPEFEQFCKKEQVSRLYADESACKSAGGFWYEPGANYSPHGPYPVRPIPVDAEQAKPTGWCDAYFTCNQTFRDAQALYNRNVFSVLIVAGLAALVSGIFIRAAAAVASGFIFGGVLSLIVGAVRYWSDMQEYLRFIILGIALIVLVWIGYRRIRK